MDRLYGSRDAKMLELNKVMYLHEYRRHLLPNVHVHTKRIQQKGCEDQQDEIAESNETMYTFNI